MKRDLELIRDLLLFYEGEGAVPFPTAAGDDAIREHMVLLVEADLLDGNIQKGGVGSPQFAMPNDGRILELNGMQYFRFRVTWRGHDFLSNARNDTIWRKTVQTITRTVGTVSLEIVQEYLKKAVKDQLGL